MVKIAVIQTCSTIDSKKNIDIIEPIIEKAASEKAELICLPEVANIVQTDKQKLALQIDTMTKDIFVIAVQKWAKEYQCWFNIACALKSDNPYDKRFVNRSIMIDNTGSIIDFYDKIHLFDVKLTNGESYKESDNYQAGNKAVICDSPWGKIGLSICYDLRFPKLYNIFAKQGVNFILAPAAFTEFTGKAHWHILTRARAVETSAYIIAANQGGLHDDGRKTYGHSLIIDPWGKIIAECNHNYAPDMLIADCDANISMKMRQQLPTWENERTFSL